MAGGETYIHEFYEVSASDVGSNTPSLGALLGTTVYGDGSVPDTRSTTDNNIEPMYSEPRLGELIWSVGCPDKLQELTGFEPKYSLSEGIRKIKEIEI